MAANDVNSPAPRRWSRFWKGLLLVLGALVLVLLAVRLIWNRIATRDLHSTVARLEANWGPLDPSSLSPPEVEDAENQARFLKAAGELVTLGGRGKESFKDRRLVGEFISDPSKEIASEEIVSLRGILERNRQALYLAAEAARLPKSNWGIPYRDGIEARLPNLLAQVDLAKVLGVKALIETRDGRPGGTVQVIEQELAISTSLGAEPVLIMQFVGMVADRCAHAALLDLLARAEPAADDLARLGSILDRCAAGNPLHGGLLGEMKSFNQLMLLVEGSHDTITTAARLSRPHLGEGSGALAVASHRLLAWLARPAVARIHRSYLERMEKYVERQRTPRYRREPTAATAGSTGAAGWVERFTEIVLPNLEGAIFRSDTMLARVGLARAAVALRRHRIERGTYPATLEALVPAYLETPPLDPFTGRPFEYRTEGAGFLLRSAGTDAQPPGFPEKDTILEWRIPR